MTNLAFFQTQTFLHLIVASAANTTSTEEVLRQYWQPRVKVANAEFNQESNPLISRYELKIYPVLCERCSIKGDFQAQLANRRDVEEKKTIAALSDGDVDFASMVGQVEKSKKEETRLYPGLYRYIDWSVYSRKQLR